MKGNKQLCLLFACVLITAGCGTSVQIPENDTIPPEVELSLVTPNRDVENLQLKTGDQNATLRILSGEVVRVLGKTSDAGGAREISVKAISGGLLKDGYGTLTDTISTSGSESDPRSFISVSGEPIPNQNSSQIQLIANGSDFSGNSAVSPIATVEFFSPASLSLNIDECSSTQTQCQVTPGKRITLNWNASGTNIEELTLRGPGVNNSSVALSGSMEVTAPAQIGSSNFYLSATTHTPQANGTTASARLQVIRERPTTVTLSAAPTSICEGDTVTLTWNAENANQVEIQPTGHISSASSGTFHHSPLSTTTYKAVAIGINTATSPDQIVRIKSTPSHIRVVKSGTRNAISRFTVTDQDITSECASFTKVSKVSMTGNLSNSESIGLTFTQGGIERTANLTASNRSTNVFNGMDPRGPWTIRVGPVHHSIIIEVSQ